MPSLKKHKEQIKSNEGFFSDISDKFDGKYYDWKITTLFYVIVHYAEALCAKHGHHSKDHRARSTFLYKKLSSEDYSKYEQLKDASQRSRYKADYLTGKASQYCLSVFNKLYKPLKKAFEEKYLL